MTIVSDIVNLALVDAGVIGEGQVASAQQQSDCLRRLNQMLSQWSARRWLVYHLVETSVIAAGVQFYTVGPGGDFDVPRPDRIEAAFIRQIVPSTPTPVDFWLTEIKSREAYAKIRLKSLVASPASGFFYDSDYPSGKFYPWPIPNGQYELHILTKAVLPAFAALADTIILPPEYEEAIYANLMMRLRIANRLPEDKAINGMAKAALNTIRRSNFQIGTLTLPAAIRRAGMGSTMGAGYNVLGADGGDILGADDGAMIGI